MRRPALRWLGWTGFGLFLIAAAYALLAILCRYRAGQPFPPGLDPFCAVLPLKDWTGFLSGGYLLFLAAFYSYWLARGPGRVPYLVVATGVLMLVRDLFLLLTPVGALPGLMPLYRGGVASGIHGTLLFDQELFFSGHTGVPFLYFLLSRDRKPVALACLAVSLLNAAGVLLTRNHYSLDVLGAFFIVPTIGAITRRLFGALDPEAAKA
ncbi:MAG: hypothetical protein HYV14_01030 [Elusimicrobia bacterium]|nr:hypothetical protein [Elusimicrobiota bacterium]